jgi:hypothetical protein
MARRSASSQSEHDRVVAAWAEFLARDLAAELKVSTNPGKTRAVRVGPDDDPRYPDVVAWRADADKGHHGSVEVITEIETAETLNEEELSEWATYGILPTPFYLVVPAGSEDETVRLLKKRRIRVSQLWSYRVAGPEILFEQFLELPGI